MPVYDHMQEPIAIDWNDGNEAKHIAKHGIPFDVAGRVFLDHGRLEVADTRKSYGELRFNTVGIVDGR